MNLFLFPFQLSNSPFTDLGLAYYISGQKSMIDLSQAHQIKNYYFFPFPAPQLLQTTSSICYTHFQNSPPFITSPFIRCKKNKNFVELNENSCPTVALTFIISNFNQPAFTCSNFTTLSSIWCLYC